MLFRYRRALLFSLTAFLLLIAFILAANFWVIRRTRDGIITRAAALPQNDVTMILGTSRTVRGRWVNPFFEGRMNAAAELYREGKTRHFLVSGDNGHEGYDEPTWMRDALVTRGVPASAITMDFAGFRTLDSMARAKAVFGLQRFTIITDDFHEPRAIFLARSYGLDVVGYPSASIPFRWSKMTRARELISRTVACVEVYALHTKPRYFGPKVEIQLAVAPEGISKSESRNSKQIPKV